VTYRPLDDFELIIDPIIFRIDIDKVFKRDFVRIEGKYVENTEEYNAELDEFRQKVLSILSDYGADLFIIDLYNFCFGFENKTRDESVESALKIRSSINDMYEEDVDLSFSTLGIDEYRDYYENIRNHLEDDNFQRFMSGYVRYLFIEHYDYWKRGDDSLLEYEQKYLRRKKIY